MAIGDRCGSKLLTTLSLSKGGVGLLRCSLNATLFYKEPVERYRKLSREANGVPYVAEAS